MEDGSDEVADDLDDGIGQSDDVRWRLKIQISKLNHSNLIFKGLSNLDWFMILILVNLLMLPMNVFKESGHDMKPFISHL